ALLGYVVVQMEQPGTDPLEAHRFDWLSGGAGYEMAFWLQSLIGWGTVLLLAFGLIMFVVFFFNITSLDIDLGLGNKDEEIDAELDEEPAPMPAAAAAPTA
nr:hypothetical protein [Tanacetum cinerariifolium]